jgi:Ca-activated chloride channel family protein
MPLTPDLSAAKMYVANASPNAVPMQGTVVGDALKTCNASLNTKEKKYKAVILISDGEDHDQKAEEAVKQLQESGVVVYTVGIGSPNGAAINEPGTNEYKKDENGNTVISKLNEKELQSIAQQTNGNYYLFTNVNEVTANILSDLGKMDKKQIAGGGQREYTTYFQWFVLLALLLLLLEVIIPERKMKWI